MKTIFLVLLLVACSGHSDNGDYDIPRTNSKIVVKESNNPKIHSKLRPATFARVVCNYPDATQMETLIDRDVLFYVYQFRQGDTCTVEFKRGD